MMSDDFCFEILQDHVCGNKYERQIHFDPRHDRFHEFMTCDEKILALEETVWWLPSLSPCATALRPSHIEF